MSGQRLPLSAAQESIWLEQCLHPDVTNCGFFGVTIRGAVAIGAIRRACLAITARHPALRAVVLSQDPSLLMRPSVEVFRFETVALPCLPGQERNAARAWHGCHPVSWLLTEHPPIAFRLLVHDDHRKTLLVDVHHIGFDGRSKFVFATEFGELLPIACRGALGDITDGPATAGPEQPVPDDDIERAARYWLDQGIQELPALVLPAPAELPAAAGMAYTDTVDVPERTCRRLADLARTEGTTFFGGLLAALSAQLWTYGNSHAVVAVTADTSTPATRASIGLQVNVVPCMVSMGASPSFRDLMRQSREALQHIALFRHVPFHMVLRRLRARTGGRIGESRFGSLSVSYPRMAGDLVGTARLALEWDMFAPNSSRSFDLVLQLRRHGSTAFGRLDYSTSLFDASTARDFVALFGEVLEQVAAPDEALRERGGVRPALAPPGRPPSSSRRHGPEQVICSVGGAPITAGDVSRAIAQLDDDGAPGGAVTLAVPADRDGAALLLAALTVCASVEIVTPDGTGPGAQQCRGLVLTREWASSQRQAAPALHAALGDPGRLLNLHAPGSEAFAAALLRGVASGCRVDIPELGSSAPGRTRMDAIPADCAIEAPFSYVRRLAAGRAGDNRPPGWAVALPMTQFIPSCTLERLAGAGRVLLHLSDAGCGLLGWSPLGSPADDDSWSAAPRVRYSHRELVVTSHDRAVPGGVPGLLAVITGAGPGHAGLRHVTPYRAWMKEGVLRFLGVTANRPGPAGDVAGPEEAERLLGRLLPGVAEAAAVWDAPTRRYEVTVVPDQAARPGAAAGLPVNSWRTAVRHRRPAHAFGAVPRRVRLSGELPRTGAGDIDRAALGGSAR